jgi:hypothetical protein
MSGILKSASRRTDLAQTHTAAPSGNQHRQLPPRISVTQRSDFCKLEQFTAE